MYAALGAGGVVVGAWFLWPLLFPGSQHPSPLRAEIAEVLAGLRLGEGRLTGGFGYVPRKDGGQRILTPNQRRAIQKYERQLKSDPSPASKADLAILKLAAGQASEAVELLEQSVIQTPNIPEWFSDLSAAYIALAEKEGRALNYVLALEASSNALRQNPRLAEARFNRALSLGRLFLVDPAKKAWTQFLSNSDDADWSPEAQAQLARLPTPELKGGKESFRHLLKVQVGNQVLPSAIHSLVNRFRWQARSLAEEDLLASWASMHLRGNRNEANRLLAEASAIADALMMSKGDQLLHDTLEVIANADGNEDQLESIAQGHIAYRKGKYFYNVGAYGQAFEDLEEAISLLTEAGSPFSLRARFSQACSAAYLSDYEAALSMLGTVRQKALDGNYHSLAAESSWMEGVTSFTAGDLGVALAAYRQALATFIILGERESVMSVQTLIAELLDYQGASDEAWRYRLAALRLGANVQDPARLRTLYSTSALAAFLQDGPAAASVFQSQAVTWAETLNNPLASGYSHFWQARYLLRCGLRAEAEKELIQAQRAVRRVEGAAGAKLAADLLLVQAEAASPGEETAVIRSLSEAIDLSVDSRHLFNLLEVYLARARAHLKLEHPDAAEIDLARGIELAEQWRARIKEDRHRVSYFDAERQIFDEMVLLQLNVRRQAIQAFNYAERGRARVLFEQLADLRRFEAGRPRVATRLSQPLNLEEAAQVLGEGVVALYYSIIGNQVSIWVLGRQGLLAFHSHSSAGQARYILESFRHGLAKASPKHELVRDGGKLYDILIRPIRKSLPVRATLVIVPDGVLSSVPFAALWDSQTERFLIEDFTVFSVPSLSVLAAIKANRQDAASANVLVVGSSSGDFRGSRPLPSLPGAEDEARQVAAHYRRAKLFTGSSATMDNFLRFAESSTVIHFAGHAVARTRAPLWSYLLLALPEGGGERRLYAHEIIRQRLQSTRIVVLSGCSTVEGQRSETEGPESLARAFLAAGVSAVLGTSVQAHDSAARELMLEVHDRLRRGSGAATALREAQLGFLASERTSSPSAWAFFGVVGDGAITVEDRI